MGHRSVQCYCKRGCYTEGLEEELDAEHIQRERGCFGLWRKRVEIE